MRASKIIFNTLKDIAAIKNINGTSRLYPLKAIEQADSTASYLIYSDGISNEPELTLDGFTGVENLRIQIDVYANGYSACEKLADTVMWALNALPDSEYISNVSMDNPDNTLSRRVVEFYLWHTFCD